MDLTANPSISTTRVGGRALVAWAPPLAVVMLTVLVADVLRPWQRLGLTTIVLYLALKATAVLSRRADLDGADRRARLLFWTLWPGFDARPFRLRRHVPTVDVHGPATQGATLLFIGLASLGALAVLGDAVGDGAAGWLTIAALLLTIHFGFADVLTAATRHAGFGVRRLFDDPLKSRSLGEFWSRRWNVAFVEMDVALFLPLLRRRVGRRVAVVGVFVVSGILHELAISYPAGGGWGLPLLYFVIEATLTVAERPLGVACWPTAAARAWTFLGVLAPLPLLFHGPFRDELVVPFVRQLAELAPPPGTAFDVLLWVAGIGNLLLLVASYQVPRRLRWREDLASLSPFNARLMWTFGGFIILAYLSIGTMTMVLHDDLLGGERAAVAIAAFCGVWWLARLVVDLVAWDDRDWPEGRMVFVGHVLLNGLFALMSSIYLTLVAWHLVG